MNKSVGSSPSIAPAALADAAESTAPPRLLDQLRSRIRTLHYSIRTEDVYVGWARRFILFHGKRHPRDMGATEVGEFLTHLAVGRHVSAATQNQAKSALLSLYKEILDIDLPWLSEVVSAKVSRRLPVVLTTREVRDLLHETSGTMGLVVSLLYGTGMRLLEGLRLRVKDIDFERREIIIREGLGNKDKVTCCRKTCFCAPAGGPRHPYRAGATGPQRCLHHHDLHPCAQPRRARRAQPAGRAVVDDPVQLISNFTATAVSTSAIA